MAFFVLGCREAIGAEVSGPDERVPSSAFRILVKEAWENSSSAKRAELGVAMSKLDEELTAVESYPTARLAARSGTEAPPSGESRGQAELSQSYRGEIKHILYSFGRDAAKKALAASATKQQNLALAEAEEALFWRVARAYLAVIASQRTEDLTKAEMANAEASLASRQTDFRIGLRPEHDVLAAEVKLSQVGLSNQKARDSSALARRQLLLLVNPQRGVSDPYTLAVPQTLLALPTPSTAEKIVARWRLGASASERRMRAEQSSLEDKRQLIRVDTRPSLSGILAYEYRSIGRVAFGQAAAELQLNWEIPWSGQSRLELAKTEGAERELSLRLAEFSEARRSSEAIALEQIAQAANLWRALRRQRELHNRLDKLVQQRYQAGKASALEVTSAEADFLETRLQMSNLVNQCAAALIAVAEARAVADLRGILE